MCGIGAIFQRQGRFPAGVLKDMADVIAHRGPDGEGYALGGGGIVRFHAGPATPPEALSAANRPDLAHLPNTRLPSTDTDWRWGLAHRRLAIIDLAPTGHQPMASTDQRYVITYNGEIYNYLELKSELEACGHRFFGHSDTEMILAAYAQWGVGCLSRFNGMFAFVLVDRAAGDVFVARDRFGVKPLYLSRLPGAIVFASEIKQFTVLPGWNPRIDWQRAHDFLQSGLTDYDAGTLFADVEQLAGGHYLHAPIDEIAAAQPVRWYSLGQQAVDVPGSFDEAAARFAELFSDAVSLRLRADVPVGTALSGGLDSSSIVCEVSAQLNAIGKGRQKTFSICASIPQYDERRFIDIVTEATGVEPHYSYPDTATLLAELPRLVWHQEEPFGGTSIFAEWEVYKLARANGVKVTLDGHGADEMLCGYHSFFWIWLNELLRRGNFVGWMREMRALGAVHGYEVADVLRLQLVTALPHHWVRPLRNLARGERASGNLLACPASHFLYHDDPHSRMRRGFNSVRCESIRQLTTSNIPTQLHWADRNSMAHSVESRLPFLDYRLVEFLANCQTSQKLGEGLTKRLLRKGMAHRLPAPIANRQDKMGFVTPEKVWLVEQEGARLAQWLDSRQDDARTLLSQASLDRAKRILRGEERYNRFAWRVISLLMWSETFAVRGV